MEQVSGSRIISTGEAIREALSEVGARDPSVLLFAEGIDDPSSIYGTTKNLAQVYGGERLIEMPVSENGLCGVAIGAAMMGKRPVISFHRVEFALLAMEQFINNAAKCHYISNGHWRAPLVLRVVVGRGWGQGPEHSQSLETLFSYVPGLKVAMPTYPGDAKGMMIAAVEDDNPVIMIEHRWCHYVQGEVPSGYYKSDLTRPRRLREGKDATIVASSYMVLEAARAADALREVGVGIDLFDLRVLRPLTLDDVFASVRRTGRLMTVDTGFRILGIGGEIVAQTMEHAFGALKAKPMRLGMPDHPTPSSRGMVQGLYPDAAMIVRELGRCLALPANKIDAVVKGLEAARGDLPVDVPDPHFRGPF